MIGIMVDMLGSINKNFKKINFLLFQFLKRKIQENPSLINQQRRSDGFTPLICAVKRNSLNSTILLLSNGVNFCLIFNF